MLDIDYEIVHFESSQFVFKPRMASEQLKAFKMESENW